MLIAIWGRDGIGKSTLSDALGGLLAKRSVTAILDTDLTQPTLPMRANGKKLSADTSLGKAISGGVTGDIAHYLHHHPHRKGLFYAGLIDTDEYMTYEIGLEAKDAAQDFISQCAGLADTVILDLSGQRIDPFIPCALARAEKVIVLITPDVQGVCWFNAVKPLLEAMNAQGRVLPVAAMVERHAIDAVEKALDLRFAAELPYVRELRQIQDTGADPLDGTTRAAARYAKQVRKLCGLLKEVGT